jgi:ABC-type multidrug transport system ATPase subunit
MSVQYRGFSQARLRLDRSTSDVERQRVVSEVLLKLGLTECADTAIGTTGKGKVLSGGEKKRLAFATEVQIK